MSVSDDCGEPRQVVPVINRNRCEAKGPCVEVCPYGVFELGVLPPADRTSLSTLGRMKAFFHGHKQAFATSADQCRGCGLCVKACPEKAITLAPAAV
jgi:NAD-dependent dihydropyrimidine dehydrogenase PreA subunit